MATVAGRNMQIKYYNGTSYVVIGGAREYSIEIKNDLVETTSADDAGIRKLLAGAGVNSITIKLSGVYVEDAASTAIRTDASTDAHRNYQLVVPGTSPKTYQGSFKVASFQEKGSYKDAVQYEMTLESAGVVTIS